MSSEDINCKNLNAYISPKFGFLTIICIPIYFKPELDFFVFWKKNSRKKNFVTWILNSNFRFLCFSKTFWRMALNHTLARPHKLLWLAELNQLSKSH
jgi:hypothetical protein